MKLKLFIIGILLCSSGTLFAQYGIGTNTPNASAALDIESPDKGVLIPRISLTNSNTLSPITGTASTSLNGMIVYNTNPDQVNGLLGPGFYFWNGGSTGNWSKLTTSDDVITGTVTDSTLRWDGSAWVENTNLLTDAAGNTSSTGSLTISGYTSLASSTISNLSITNTTTLNGALVDGNGSAGTAGQVLSTTSTSTAWIDTFAPASGTVTDSTLRWSGSAWLETQTLLSGTNSATFTQDLSVNANANITGTLGVTGDTGLTANLNVGGNTDLMGTLEVTGNSTLTADLNVGGNTALTGTLEVTGDSTTNGSLTANSTTTLNAALVDGNGSAGTAGQVLSTTSTSTAWIDTFAPASGTVTDSTLRWSGSAWLETQTLLSGTNSATFTQDLSVNANADITGTLEVTGNTTLTADLNVGGNTALTGTLEVAGDSTTNGSLTANSTTTLNAALVDGNGSAGTAGQVLSTTSTSTAWIDTFAPASGTVTDSTLRWDGSAWVETQTLLSGTSSATFTQDLTVAANADITGTLEVTGNTTLTADLTIGGDTTANGGLTANSSTTLNAALIDSTGATGTAGQILSSTGTATQWVAANASTLATMTTTGSVTANVGLLLIEPSANVTITLADASSLPVGYELKIRRNQGYTGTNDSVTLVGHGVQTIDGMATRTLNNGYQSLTLLNIGGAWVTVN